MNRLIIIAVLISFWGTSSAKKIVKAKWEYPKYENADSIYILDYRYDSDGKLFYMLSNDSANLFVHGKFVEEASQQKLLMAGFNVWVDINDKGKEALGVKYPLPPENKTKDAPHQRQGQGERSQKGRTKNFDPFKAVSTLSQDLELVNFPGEPEIVFISPIDNHDIAGKLKVNKSGIVYYTLKIPFKSIGLDYTPGQLISIILESGELTNNTSGAPSRMSGGSQSSMGGGPPSGGSGGPSGGGGSRPSGGGPPSSGGQGGGSQMSGSSQSQSNSQIRIRIKHLELL